MNVDNILKVADAIESHAIATLGFSMKSYYGPANSDDSWDRVIDLSGHNCGTVACIAGWTVCVLQGNLELPFDVHREAKKLFDIDGDTSDRLFTPGGEYPYTIDNHQAARTLRHFAETGGINFRVGLPVDTEQNP